MVRGRAWWFGGVALATFAGCIIDTDGLSGGDDGADASEGGDAIATDEGALDSGTDVVSPCTVNEPGLIAYWRFDEGKGTVITDCSGNGLHGGIVGAGPQWDGGRDGGSALWFEGDAGGHVEIGNPALLHITGSITVAGWYWAAKGLDSVTIGKGGGGTMRGWAIDFESDNSLNFQISSAPTTEIRAQIEAGVAIRNVWVHVAGVFDAANGTVSLYVNGSLVNQITGPSAMVDEPLVVHIGERSDGCCRMTGAVSEMRVYGRALAAPEVAVLAAY